jgi:DNA polymerase III alpha subunit (gram-positive type)
MAPIADNTLCPECRTGELISIGMLVSERDLSFTTCHMCEAKWWFQDGELVPLASVIGTVASH